MKRGLAFVPCIMACAGCFTVAVAAPAQAADDDAPHVYGIGAYSCGVWLSDAKNNNTHQTNVHWAMGWLSAAGVYNPAVKLRHTDFYAVSAYMDKYCRENPLNSVYEGAASLVQELAKPQ
jgi:hypothetical protein